MAEYLLFGGGWNGQKIIVPGEPLQMVPARPRDEMRPNVPPRRFKPRAIDEILNFQVHRHVHGVQIFLIGISDGVMPVDNDIERAIALERPIPIGAV